MEYFSLLLFIFLFAAFYTYSKKKNRDNIEKIALNYSAQLIKQFKILQTENAVNLEEVNCQNYTEFRTLHYYESMQKMLEERGFHFLTDFVDRTLCGNEQEFDTFIRLMSNSSSKVLVSLVDTSPKGVSRIVNKISKRDIPNIFLLSTYFENGSVLKTANYFDEILNSFPGTHINEPESILSEVELLALHEEKIGEIEKSEGTTALSIESFAEYENSYSKTYNLNAAFRREQNLLLTEEEQVRFEQLYHNPRMIEIFRNEIEKANR